VVHNYGNIECRDAVLAWDAQEVAYDAHGQLLSRWDGATFKTHPVTGEQVPDETAQVPQWRYVGARQAQWPQADFIVGNPPFIFHQRVKTTGFQPVSFSCKNEEAGGVRWTTDTAVTRYFRSSITLCG